MKKIFTLFFLSFFIVSCFWWANKDDIEKAKNDALNGIQDKTIETWNLKDKENIWEENSLENSQKDISYKYLTDDKFIKIDSFSKEDFSDLKQEITWTTIWEVDKIDISYENTTNWKKSNFSLKKFKKGDETFMFRAFKEYETLDYWKNIFVITAHSWDKISKLEYIVNIEKDLENNQKEEIKAEAVDSAELPVSAVFWNPVEIWNWKVTYSDIKWLEIEKVWTIDLENNEESVTNFLRDKYKTVFYWNTKRAMPWEKWISFFVVRVDWNNYIYEKHFYNWEYYWILPLEKGDFDSSLSLEEKTKALSDLNIALREKNNSYEKVAIADSLFQSFKR